MSLRTRVIPALYNGVSQQPPLLRSPDQTEAELNTWSTMTDGLGRRPPTETLAKVSGGVSSGAFVHHINRDVSERYIVVIDEGQLKVFDHITGAAKTVNAPGGFGYLAGGPYRAVTVADYTFILNTAVACEMDTVGADTTIDPSYFQWLNRDDPFGIGLYPANPTGSTYAGEVASMDKLPETAANGTKYKVVGSVDTLFVSYYVVRNGAVWDETVGDGLANALKATTMPHALKREADGTFTFAPFSWANRAVGDDESNPKPTFIGRTIRDVFFYQNRLGFLVDENVVFSCAGDFGNFWRNTVLDYIASDVVDVAVTTANVALLNYAIPFNDGIMAFADQVQFSITNGENGLSPESVAIQPITRYEVNQNVRPVSIGTEVYYCGDQNGASVVWEHARVDGADTVTAAEITAHCPRYLPAGLTKLVAAQNLKALFATTGGSSVYAYQFYWNGNEKIQSAWRKWDFGSPVLSAEYIGGYLYLLMQRGDGVFIERLHLETSAKPAEQDFQIFLDRRGTVTGTYDPVNDRTVYSLPYAPLQSSFRLVRVKTHATKPGSLIDPTSYVWLGAQSVAVPGNEPGVTFGEAYMTSFEFSRQFPVDYQQRPLTTGRLQLRTMTLYFTQTGFFRTEVRPYGIAGDAAVEEIIPTKLAEFSGKVVGAADLILNSPSFHTGAYSFQVYGDAAQATIRILNDTHVASTFVSAEWEGFYFNRAGG